MSKVVSLDLAQLQKGDPEIQKLAEAGKDPTGKDTLEQKDEIFRAIDSSNSPRWIVPTKVRGNLIQIAHEQDHRGKDITLDRVRNTGWWPGMRLDIGRWIDNGLACAMVNADHSGSKAPISHQCIEGP